MGLEEEYIQIGSDIIHAAFEVRNNAGAGMLESFYEAALVFELQSMGYKVASQAIIPAIYRGNIIKDAFHADIIVDDKVIIELKALSKIGENEFRQLYTYLTLSNLRLGYLINFGAQDFSFGKWRDHSTYTKGLFRIVNNLR